MVVRKELLYVLFFIFSIKFREATQPMWILGRLCIRNSSTPDFPAVNNERGDWLCEFPRDEQSPAIFRMMQIISTERAFGGNAHCTFFSVGTLLYMRVASTECIKCAIVEWLSFVRMHYFVLHARATCLSLMPSLSVYSWLCQDCIREITTFTKCIAIRNSIIKTKLYYYFN